MYRRFALISVNTRKLNLIQPYIVYIILNCWNLLQIIHIFLLMDLKMAIKQLRLLFVNLLSSQNVYLTRRQFTAELEALVSALRYIKITAKIINNCLFSLLCI